MGTDASAYAILGLRPGADRAAVDEAYRRLIKLHHPDRSGGDASRAAEINRAYFELRGKRGGGEPQQAAANGDIGQAIYARRAARSPVQRPFRRRRRLLPFALVAAGALLVIKRDMVMEAGLDFQDQVTGGWRPAGGRTVVLTRRATAASGIEGELSGDAIDAAIARAKRLARAETGDTPAAQSRECHRQMRSDPGVEQLDRCAAFDYAVSLLEDRDPVADQGPFSATGVTARQMAAASLLSNDYLAIEGRLDRIRGRVEMAIAPPADASGGAQPPP